MFMNLNEHFSVSVQYNFTPLKRILLRLNFIEFFVKRTLFWNMQLIQIVCFDNNLEI